MYSCSCQGTGEVFLQNQYEYFTAGPDFFSLSEYFKCCLILWVSFPINCQVNFLFLAFHCLCFICFFPRSENGTSPNQSCCSLPVTSVKYQSVRALHAYPRTPEGLAACVEDALRLRLAGGVRHRHGCDVAQAGTKGEGLSVNHLLRKGRLLSALLTTLLFL